MTQKGIEELESASKQLLGSLAVAKDLNAFNQIKSEYLGKTSIINKIFAEAKKLPPEQFKCRADQINKYRADWNSKLQQRLIEIKQHLEATELAKGALDVTLPAYPNYQGSQHPISLVQEQLVSILSKLGFQVAEGPEIEDDFHNFSALNVPEHHPARAMQDTFYFADGSLLRTQTSSVQIHALKSQELPLRIIASGKVYRRDYDQTHSPMFHQLEMLNVDKTCNFSDLKAVLVYTFRSLFGEDIKFRFRPSYFPFTEPSGELDIEWHGSWLEVAGYGMVHPNVLEMQGIDSEIYSGYAFGVGLDRLAMLLYDIDDLRLFFQNDLRFLKQFTGDLNEHAS